MVGWGLVAMRTLEALRRVDMFQDLSEDDLAAVVACGNTATFGSKVDLFLKDDPGDALFAILEGEVEIHTSSEDGKTMRLNMLTAGDVLGEIGFIDGRARTASATTVRETTLFCLRRSAFLALLEERPKIAIAMMQVLAQRVRWVSAAVEAIAFKEVPQRLAAYLVAMAQEQGVEANGIITFPELVRQEWLAEALGVSREIVNKAFRVLKEDGAASYVGKRLVISSMAKLRERAGVTEPGKGR